MSSTKNKQWYKELDISPQGFPTGIDSIEGMLPQDICYCIISKDGVIDQVDVFKNGQKIHYKKFAYGNLGRVIENMMYSPGENGKWHIEDDVWYYEYSPVTGVRTKKVIQAPGALTAYEILYDEQGNRTSEKTINLA